LYSSYYLWYGHRLSITGDYFYRYTFGDLLALPLVNVMVFLYIERTTKVVCEVTLRVLLLEYTKFVLIRKIFKC